MAYFFYVRKIHENVFSRSFWKPSAIYKEQRKNNLDLHICSLPSTLQCTQSRKKRRGISTSCFQGWLVFTRTVVYTITHTKIQSQQKLPLSHNSIRWNTHIATYWYFGVIPSICLDDISLNNVSPNVPLPSGIFFYLLDNASSDESSLGQCHSWLTHLLDDVSLVWRVPDWCVPTFWVRLTLCWDSL